MFCILKSKPSMCLPHMALLPPEWCPMHVHAHLGRSLYCMSLRATSQSGTKICCFVMLTELGGECKIWPVLFTCHWIFCFYASNYWILSSLILPASTMVHRKPMWWSPLWPLCVLYLVFTHTIIHKGSVNPSRNKEPDHVIYLYLLVGDKVGINLVKCIML